jgi:integrase
MAKVNLENVKSYINRHGKVVHYFRRKGSKLVRLPGLPGSDEFMLAYNAALGSPAAQVKIEPGAVRTKAGSVGAMIAGYLASSDYYQLRESSKAQYQRILNMLREQFGDLSIAKLERQHVKLMLEGKATVPTVARTMLRILRILIVNSMDAGLRKDDPTVGLRVKLAKSNGHPTWSDEDIKSFEAAYPLGTKQRMALALLLNFAARCSDVVRVGPGNVRDDELTYTQQKTGVKLTIPMLDETSAAINAVGPSEHLVFLVNDTGAAFTEQSFSKWFVRQCKRAEVMGGLSPHGLRKAACVRLAHAGCTTPEIGAISGHKSLKEIERYIREAQQVRLARSAMARLRGQKGGA